ncbi:uncharacterized protein LTR77_003392 [Saxophila tyrrhenica]|uniref:SET domain-containing protein n=1 Tax=Saxophila tyrrhenica TaxID=1690608 RepID=A0AAV9PDJ4_9PEZI|nr:hypothetical protein LTR77_003392 [Saxophila tyrrhenica]
MHKLKSKIADMQNHHHQTTAIPRKPVPNDNTRNRRSTDSMPNSPTIRMVPNRDSVLDNTDTNKDDDADALAPALSQMDLGGSFRNSMDSTGLVTPPQSPTQHKIPRRSLEKPLPSVPSHDENDYGAAQPRRDISSADLERKLGVDGVLDLDHTEDTTIHERMAPAVVHNTVRRDVHEIVHEQRTRDIHEHHVHHRILPIMDIEVKPARHFIKDDEGRCTEISESQIPGRASKHTQRVVEEVWKDTLPKTKSQPGPRLFSARDFSGSQGDAWAAETPEGAKLTEQWTGRLNMAGVGEPERRQILDLLKRNFELKSMPPETAEKYGDKILSGSDNVWIRQLASALQSEKPDIFAGLDGTPKASASKAPDVATLLSMQDENERVASASSRCGQKRSAAGADAIFSKIENATKEGHALKESRHFVPIIEPYPPCVLPLKDLKTVKLSDLTQETHHRGRALLIQRVSPVAREGTALISAIKDDNGDVENIELHHVDTALEDHMLPERRTIVIKEPYLTLRRDGTATIRIDHPTDIVLGNHDLKVGGPKGKEAKTASQWKQTGNELLGQKKLWQARDAYRNGSVVAGADEQRLILDLARNLARVDLDLGRYDEAVDAATKAVSDGSDSSMNTLDGKAHYRAASASYNLREYGKAQDCLSKLIKLDKNDAEGNREMQRVQARLAEKKSGKYEFDKLVGKLSPQAPRADIADYTEPVEVKEAPVGGRGLFATQDLKTGDLVLCEKAFSSLFEKDKNWFAAWEYNHGKLSMASSTVALWDQVMQKVLQNPSTIEEVTQLVGDYAGLGAMKVHVDDMNVVDAFQVRSIIESNTFGIPTPSKQAQTRPFGFTAEFQQEGHLGDNTGLFLKTSMMNHSCVPNTRKVFVGDAIVIRATRPIKKGEELVQSYAQTDADVAERRGMLESTWHFRCNCKLCAVEERESEDKRKNREDLESRANQLGMAIKNGSAGSQGVSKADVLLKSIKGTYDPDLYKPLPRKAGMYLHVGLIHHYARQNQRTRCTSMITSLFEMLGWKLDIGGGKAELDRKEDSETHIVPELVDVLLLARSMQLYSGGRSRQTEQLESIARELYLAINGVPCGWEPFLRSKT